MNGQKVLGIIFSNSYDEKLGRLTDMRTMGSVPFCARYRMIDFSLSAMARNGINQVGIVTNANFQSLMDHVGTGKAWDLSRKKGGMFLLPPFNPTSYEQNETLLDSIYNNRNFIRHSNKEYVLLTLTNTITNIDLDDMFDFREKTDADILLFSVRGKKPSNDDTLVITSMNEDGRITDAALNYDNGEETIYMPGIMLIKKYILESLVENAYAHNRHHFYKDVIMSHLSDLKIYAYMPDVFSWTIDSVQSYYDMSMTMLDSTMRKKLFMPDRPVYTKVRDDMPTRYGTNSKIKNSLIADGCIVEGTVENSILFRGVKVKPGAVIRNSIIMQDSIISENTNISYLIADKNVLIKENIDMKGAPNYPICLSKNTVV